MSMERVNRLANTLAQQGIGAVVVSPGPDLRYLAGYDAVALERLTALVVRPGRDPILVSPLLERAAAAASAIGKAGVEIATWTESESPYDLLSGILGSVSCVAVDGRMWAEKLINIQTALAGVRTISATPAIAALRQVKSAAEVESLRAAGNAIDSVHAQVASFLRPGRTEAEVGADIARAIIESGHVSADFVIVGSGPNSASPHHEVSDRVMKSGDAVVVDIGGTMPDGYCSDSTRTYFLGEPDAGFVRDFEVLHRAQQAASAAVKPGVPCEEIDRIARDIMTDAGIGDLFIHRIGHGIGLETHEHPYMIAGNETPMEIGFAFSIEPGFYRDGVAGARIEDIVVCGGNGADVLNNRPRELTVID